MVFSRRHQLHHLLHIIIVVISSTTTSVVVSSSFLLLAPPVFQTRIRSRHQKVPRHNCPTTLSLSNFITMPPASTKDRDDDEEEDDYEPKSKKVKHTAKDDDDDTNDDEEDANEVKRNDDGEVYYELAGKKRCTVRKWKKAILVDIREVCSDMWCDSPCIICLYIPKFIMIICLSNYSDTLPYKFYEKDGKTLPGKKGISLSLDQYKTLRTIIMDGSLDKQIQQLEE